MAQSLVHRGSVVLIRYPFTDFTAAKVRPALGLTPRPVAPSPGRRALSVHLICDARGSPPDGFRAGTKGIRRFYIRAEAALRAQNA